MSDLISIYVSLPLGRNKRKETLVQGDNRKCINRLKYSNKILVRSLSEDELDFEEDGSEDEYLPMLNEMRQLRYEKMMGVIGMLLSLSLCLSLCV